MTESSSRRPLASRDKTWARRSATWLKERGVKPNSISVFSTGFAIVAAAALVTSARTEALLNPLCRAWFLLVVVIGVMGRLICNLLDGMVAVEGGLKTASGEVFNDLPDRISDLVIFAAMGFAASPHGTELLWVHLGWLAAALAILTAYIRYLGAACGVGHSFMGPMAKQHRMAVTITATIASALLEPKILDIGMVFRAALGFIVVGALITCVRRTLRIVRELEAKGVS